MRAPTYPIIVALALILVAAQSFSAFAQRGERDKALEWLEKAFRLRDPGFRRLKTDPLMDPLRKEPRFQAIERELKFPD